jgi:hypothetical protein
MPLTCTKLVCSLALVFSLPISVRAEAVPFHLQTLDQTGAGFPNVLVIVRSLEDQKESFRALTDQSGTIAAYRLAPGLYQIIATCPYGICETAVREFIVRTSEVHLEVKLGILPTQGNVVRIGPVSQRRIEVRGENDKPVSSAQVLVRDANAQNETWYKTGADGAVMVALPPGEATIVAVYDGTLVTRTLNPHRSDEGDGTVTLHLR